MADQTLLVVSPASTGSEIDAIEPSLLQMLPCDILEKIETLKIELQDGDITTKGFVKKRGRLLEPFILIQQQETIANLFFNENGGKLKRAISKSNGNVAGEDQHLQVPPSPSVSANNIAAGTTSGGGGGGGGGGSRRGSNNRKSHLFMSNYDSFIQGSNSSLSTSPPVSIYRRWSGAARSSFTTAIKPTPPTQLTTTLTPFNRDPISQYYPQLKTQKI